jgi:ketopantoate hydroxymethyltransferase
LAEEIMKAMEAYVRDVKELKFPENEHTYNMLEGEKEKLDGLIKSVK